MLRILYFFRVFARRFDSFLLHTSLNYHRTVQKSCKPFKNFCYFYFLNRSFSKIVIFVILEHATRLISYKYPSVVYKKTTPFYIFLGHENTYVFFSFMYLLFCAPYNLEQKPHKYNSFML